MLRYFAGLGVDETARALGIGETKVKAEWNYARAWLFRQMAGEA
jgi:DNA-directed RNA polymerase specialized sigma24 family protein